MNRFGTQYQSTNPFLAQSGVYRYGFQGKESDLINPGCLNFEHRVFNSLLCRMMSTDPLYSVAPHFSPYSICGLNPILFIDNLGLVIDFPAAPDGQTISEEERLFWEIYDQSPKEYQLELDNLITSDITYSIRFVDQTKLGGGGATYYDRSNSDNITDVVKIEVKASLNPAMKVWAMGDELETATQIEAGAIGFIEQASDVLNTFTFSNDMKDEWETQCAGASAFLNYRKAHPEVELSDLDPNQANLAVLFNSAQGRCVGDETHARNWFNTPGSPQEGYLPQFGTCDKFECATSAHQGGTNEQWREMLNSPENKDGFSRVMFKRTPAESLQHVTPSN